MDAFHPGINLRRIAGTATFGGWGIVSAATAAAGRRRGRTASGRCWALWHGRRGGLSGRGGCCVTCGGSRGYAPDGRLGRRLGRDGAPARTGAQILGRADAALADRVWGVCVLARGRSRPGNGCVEYCVVVDEGRRGAAAAPRVQPQPMALRMQLSVVHHGLVAVVLLRVVALLRAVAIRVRVLPVGVVKVLRVCRLHWGRARPRALLTVACCQRIDELVRTHYRGFTGASSASHCRKRKFWN